MASEKGRKEKKDNLSYHPSFFMEELPTRPQTPPGNPPPSNVVRVSSIIETNVLKQVKLPPAENSTRLWPPDKAPVIKVGPQTGLGHCWLRHC